MSGSSGGQWQTIPDTEPQASQAVRQASRGASRLRGEEACSTGVVRREVIEYQGTSRAHGRQNRCQVMRSGESEIAAQQGVPKSRQAGEL